MLSPWSARSSTSSVCAHSFKLGSPSSLTMYRAGSAIDPTPFVLWSLDFSMTEHVSIASESLGHIYEHTSSYALRVLIVQEWQGRLPLLQLCTILNAEDVGQQRWDSVATDPSVVVSLKVLRHTLNTHRNWLTPSSNRYRPYGTIAALLRLMAGGIVIWPVVGSGTPASSGMSYSRLASSPLSS